jgi:hypothetical protein
LRRGYFEDAKNTTFIRRQFVNIGYAINCGSNPASGIAVSIDAEDEELTTSMT